MLPIIRIIVEYRIKKSLKNAMAFIKGKFHKCHQIYLKLGKNINVNQTLYLISCSNINFDSEIFKLSGSAYCYIK